MPLNVVVTKDLTDGEKCNEDYDSTSGLICQSDLVCDSCPENEEDPEVCQIPLEHNGNDPTM